MAVTVVGTLILGSCAEEEKPGGDGDPNEVMPGQLCARFAQIQCAAEANCCEAAGRDVAACVAEVQESCEDTGVDMIAGDDLVAFNQAALKSALDELESRNADCDPTTAAWAVTTAGFASAFRGTRASGDDCVPEGGAMNASFTQIGAALASCMNVGTTACLPTSDDSWTCAARGAAGSPCFTDFNCQDSLWCDTSAATGLYDGACTARKAAGTECDDGNECVSFVCKNDACAAPDDVQAAFCLAD